MYLGRVWLKYMIKGTLVLFVIFGLFTWFTYDMARQSVNAMFPQLVRLVAEDNCLDNTIVFSGRTTFQTYRDALDAMDAASPIIEFRADAIDVPFTSRASAPQRGTVIPVTLTGYWVLTFPMFDGHIRMSAPIVRSLDVIGIREYRDR